MSDVLRCGMPTAPLKLCAHPGCAARVPYRERHCGVHAREEAKAREARRSPRTADGEALSGGGRKADWRALRAACLARDPICRLCGERKATHADHVVPKRAGGRDVIKNLQGTCHRCHSAKTAASDGGFGNPRRGVTR